jgi:hypothetical protein
LEKTPEGFRLMKKRNAAIELSEEPGAVKLLREAILEVGTQKFGPPTQHHIKKLAAIKVAIRLARLGLRLHTVDSWDELLKGK